MVKAEIMTRSILEHQRVVPVGLADCLVDDRGDASEPDREADAASGRDQAETVETEGAING